MKAIKHIVLHSTATTHIAKIRQTDRSLIDQVCILIGWSYERYCDYQFNNYVEFVDRMFDRYPLEMVNEVKYSATFRGFWNNEASLRNQTEFLPFAQFEPEDSPVLLSEFLYTHSVLTLMHDDLFLMKYNRVLDIIRKEAKCH